METPLNREGSIASIAAQVAFFPFKGCRSGSSRHKCIVKCKTCTAIQKKEENSERERESESILYLGEVLETTVGFFALQCGLAWTADDVGPWEWDRDKLALLEALKQATGETPIKTGQPYETMTWHAIRMKGFKLDTVLVSEVPRLRMHGHFVGSEAVTFGTKLFFAGGWKMPLKGVGDEQFSNQVHSIDTQDTRVGWEDTCFTVPRCTPRLVVFKDNLYAFGASLSDEAYFESENISRPWAEVYIGGEHKGWIPVVLGRAPRKLPACILGDAIDTDGNLLLFCDDRVLSCCIDHQGRLFIKVLQSFDVKLNGHDPILIGHYLYLYDSSDELVKGYNLNNKALSTVVGIDEEDIKVKANVSYYFKSRMGCRLRPCYGGFCMLKVFYEVNPVTKNMESFTLVCTKLDADGPNATVVDASAIPVKFSDIMNSALVSMR